MRKFFVPLAVTCLLAASGMANAAHISGKVSNVDVTNSTLTLTNGMKFNVKTNVNLYEIEEGAEVQVAYEEKDGRNVASAIEADETDPLRHKPSSATRR